MDWIYLASPTQGTEADTVRLALQEHVISRPTRNSRGAAVSNVGHIRPGDRMVLAYRRRGAPPAARVIATIGVPGKAVSGTHAIDEVAEPRLVEELRRAGFPLSLADDGAEVAHVIHLTDVIECEVALSSVYPGQTTLRRLSPRDYHCIGSQPDGEAKAPPLAPVRLPPSAHRPEPEPAPATTQLEWQATRPAFDVYIMVDWSGSSTPSSGANSIWLARGEWGHDKRLVVQTVNPRTREAATDTLLDWCRQLSDQRVLLGFDFSLGYPRGFSGAARLPESEAGPWQSVHDHLGQSVTDLPDNSNNMYLVAEGLNERIANGGPGPFWGCPPTRATASLTTRRIGHFPFPYAGLCEWRLTEQRARRSTTTQSVWKLNCGVSVGGQSILGIHRLRQLRQALARRAAIWPFQTGWMMPSAPDAVVIAEVFPSVIPIVDAAGGTVRDAQQVRSCVWFAAARDVDGTLAEAFAQPRDLAADDMSVAETEEGWILFA